MSAADATVQPAHGLSRRQALRVVAAAVAVPAGFGLTKLLGPSPRFHEWQGVALGADSSLTLWHPNEKVAERAIDRMLAEVARLERAFSLFRPDSEISRLNRDGLLDAPSSDWATLLDESRRLAALTGGGFDPTVQPLWTLYADYFANGPADPSGPPEAEVVTARALVDLSAVEANPRRLRFGKPGMAMTLNGIAQGYITDRVADMLRNDGFDHVFVELGESRALGDHPEGRPWRLGIKAADRPTAIARTLEIADEAVAVSGGYGTRFDETGRNHHIFDPHSGHSATVLLGVTVIGPRATIADGLSTALYVGGEAGAAAVLAGYPGYRAILTRADGSELAVG